MCVNTFRQGHWNARNWTIARRTCISLTTHEPAYWQYNHARDGMRSQIGYWNVAKWISSPIWKCIIESRLLFHSRLPEFPHESGHMQTRCAGMSLEKHQDVRKYHNSIPWSWNKDTVGVTNGDFPLPRHVVEGLCTTCCDGLLSDRAQVLEAMERHSASSSSCRSEIHPHHHHQQQFLLICPLSFPVPALILSPLISFFELPKPARSVIRLFPFLAKV